MLDMFSYEEYVKVALIVGVLFHIATTCKSVLLTEKLILLKNFIKKLIPSKVSKKYLFSFYSKYVVIFLCISDCPLPAPTAFPPGDPATIDPNLLKSMTG